MSKIGIIDDNKAQRETLKSLIESHLDNFESSIEVVDVFPFADDSISLYKEWIEQNEIICLIFDEQMHNDSEEGKGPVGYRGNQLVLEIRKYFMDIPIYVITSHKNDDDLQKKFSEFEDIIGREEFIVDGEKYVKRFIRASQSFLNENIEELSELKQLSEIVASGKNDENDLNRLKALQLKLNVQLDSGLGERKDWLDEYENKIQFLEDLQKKIENKIKE
ncbi:response regulator [Lutibacter flavus]|uniref:Response regulator receiver domain-containing protein n=1 Tax=Lutibacter flavus TaxID=691689 RepID=A0A238YDF2_9FLAO|nr:response regulator [Lutibacter flavus]SNR68633.1 Response regulator receiver domain-containing protein [Lutibacter flavus]